MAEKFSRRASTPVHSSASARTFSQCGDTDKFGKRMDREMEDVTSTPSIELNGM